MSDPSYNDRAAVFNYLMTCGPLVKVTTGAVLKGIVHHDYVTVHSAPSRMTHEIVAKFKHVSLSEDGLLIPLEPAKR